MPLPPLILSSFEEAIKVIEKAGATVVDNLQFDQNALTKFLNAYDFNKVLGADFKSDLPKYLSQLTVNPNNVHSLADLRDFTRKFGPEDFPDRDSALG